MGWLATLKRIEKSFLENAFDEKNKRPGLKFNPGLALISLQTTRPWKKCEQQHLVTLTWMLGSHCHEEQTSFIVKDSFST